MSEPIDTYVEVHPNHRRWFELYSDRILIQTKNISGEAHFRIDLCHLRAEPDTKRARPNGYRLAACLLLLALLPLTFIQKLLQFVPLDVVVPSCIALLIVGLAIGIKTFPKIEFRSFTTPEGTAAFDIARCGPDRDRFDAFVDKIIQQIKECQKAKARDQIDK